MSEFQCLTAFLVAAGRKGCVQLLFIISIWSPTCCEAAIIPGSTVVNPSNGHTYFLLSPMSWIDAQAEAEVLGGNLVTINDGLENDWVVSTFAPMLPGTLAVWIGINDLDVEGEYTWASGEPLSYTNWNNGEPNDFENNEDVGEIYLMTVVSPRGQILNAGYWNDISVGFGIYPGIVEIAVPEPSTAVILALISGIAILRRR